MKMFIKLLLVLLVNSYGVRGEFVEINTNDYSQELEAEDNNDNSNYYIDNSAYGSNRKNEKRDVIKGPSLFSKIDASIADSDLAFENEDITGHSDLSRFYEKPHNIEDKLDDMDTWIAPNTHHLSPQLHVHKKKSFTAHAPRYHSERASKKSTFPRHRRVRYEDVPDEVIKALYNWQLDDAQNAAKKSILGNNSMEDSNSSEERIDEDEEQEEKSRRKKRRKINVLVNVKIKESPSVSSLVSLRPKTVIGEKRHFPYFYPRHRRYGIHRSTMVPKNILTEDSGSADGSGSGMNERVTAGDDKSTSKLVTDGESEESEGSGSGRTPTNLQHVQIRVASPQEQTAVVEPLPPPAISAVGGKNDSAVVNTRNDTAPKELVQKVAQREDGAPSETNNDQEGSADQQTDEKQGEKVIDSNSDVSEKSEGSVKVASGPVAQQTVDSGESGPKEEPTDGSDNMKKKSGQEDKYETLEEVREKFKKWESKIIQRPSENAVNENNNVATKSTDAETTSVKTEDEHTEKSQEKTDDSSTNENEKPEESKLTEKVDGATEEKPLESTKWDKVSPKSEEKPLSKTDESAGAASDVKSDSSPDISGKNNTSEKKDESLESNATSAKPDETTGTQTKGNVTEESKDMIKSNFLSSGILITEKGDTSSDEEQQHLIKQKEPDDFVKELIGIPTKKLILKEKEESKSGAKAENKIEKESEDARLLSKPKSADETEEKFNIEEVNSKNKEHHDIPDSDMKEGAHSLNAADVASFENQVSSSDEGPSPEKTSFDGTSAEEKTSSQVVEEKSSRHGNEQHSKQALMANTKTLKHQTEAESVAKQVEDSSKHNPSAKKKKISGAGDENEEVESPHDKAALANPLITKEANEFSNEQEKSFASAIEKIKAQEEKLKGKEIDSEIQETLSPSKKHSGSNTKKGESNMKQLKVYRHQILSEVKKIDDLISEYHKDGHSTKELSEAKVVLQQDLNLVKELEKNTKKKSIKKEKEKEGERLQVMPSSAYLSSNDESKEIAHRGKSALDSKSTTKSLEREAERSEKQLEEYYFHTNSKSSVKHPKKPSLEEIHKLLKAEIKSLRQKKNGKADHQLKNIRKLVQQHLKKLISTGDIDKSAFHSLAPEIRQLGDLLKERIKSLKKKKTHNAKTKSLPSSKLTQKLKQGNKKAIDQFEQSMEAQVSTNELKGGKVKADKQTKSRHFSVEPKIGILEPSLENVKGLTGKNPELPSMTAPGSEHQSFSTGSTPASAPPEATKEQSEHNGGLSTHLNESMSMSAMSGTKGKTGGEVTGSPGMNIQHLLNTLNEKLGVVYDNAKSVNDAAHKITSQPETTTLASKEQSAIKPELPVKGVGGGNAVYEQPIPGLSAGATQRYVSQKPQVGGKTVSANVPTTPMQPMQLQLTVHPAGPPQITTSTGNETPPAESAEQIAAPAAPAAPVNPPQVVDATEAPAVAANIQPQEMESSVPETAPATQSATVPEQESQANETPTPEVEPHQEASADNKENLPMVPEEPEFEEDTTEALASLEPINTLVETLEKDITEIWSYKDLYPNAEALGLDNEKVHNTYANLGSLSGLSLRRALNRALRGEDVGLGVVGGSISKGGPFSEKGLEYVLRSYFYAIEDYWNKVIRPVTGSSMVVRDVSLGGISTDYYSFCIRNHLPDDKLTNIVLWELSANDMRRYDDSLKPKPQPLEQFTRNILTYRAKPSLIFVNFFALFDWDPDLRANCRNFEDEGEDDVAKYYKITSLSWRNMVCPLLKSETSPIFTRSNLFAEDHFHPSILGHAQMSYIIIDYIRTEFLKNLVKMRPFFIGDAVEKLQIPRSIYMPRPMFKETFLWKPLCYTYMLVDNRLPNNTMPLHEENESDFKYTVVRGFKIRSDKIAGMETKLKDQFIRYRLQIPRHEDGGIQPFKQLGIMSFTDDRYAEVQFDSQHPSRLEAKKRFLEGTVIKTIAENIEPGEHTLTVRSGDIGFLVCALVLG